MLLFPVAALRAIGLAMWALVANPVGLTIGGLVAALTALGVWVYNNWNGIKSFFAGFGEGFMQGLGPAAGAVKSLADGFGSVVNWLSQLLGSLDESGSKWRAWDETVGGIAASGVKNVNDTLRRLTADGAAAVAGSTTNTTTRGSVSFSPVFHITGGDPREVAGQVRTEMRRFLAELESEQRGFLSD